MGMFDYGGGGFHCVHVTDQDLDVFRRHRMYVITNPGSNTKLASGIAPIADYVRHKIPVAIGTDGPASNNCLDMFREMFLVTGLSKLARTVDVYARRPQIQERLTVQIADALERVLAPKGIMVMLEAEHTCMTMRGIKKPGSKTVTTVTRGEFKENMELQKQFLAMVKD